ncbi:MAG: hypothetical protein NC390_00805 [Fusobacterium sp.]|nr:hypothetical protein [Fusobacterium sp.]
MAEVGALGGAGKAESLWTKAAEVKRKPVEEQAGGMTASFAPNGANFLDTVKSTFGTSGNNCAGI